MTPLTDPHPHVADRDGDGVVDDKDACPADPGVAPEGCPIPDTDGDGVLDPDDQCPTVPETRNAYQDEDGCPDDIPAVAEFTGTLKSVTFAAGTAAIRPGSWPALDRVASILNEFAEMRVELSGHTDDRERSPARLSLRRAEAVKRYLIERGVDAAKLQVRGAGADEPIADNGSKAGRASNRRVSFLEIE